MTGVDIDIKCGDEILERVYMEKGDTLEAEVHCDDYVIEVVDLHE